MWSNTPSTNSWFQKRGHLKGSKRESIKNTNCRMWDEKSWKSSMLQISLLLPSSLFPLPFPEPLDVRKVTPPKSFMECFRCNYPLIFHKLNRSGITPCFTGMLQFVSESLLNHHPCYLKLLKCLKSMWLHRRLGSGWGEGFLGNLSKEEKSRRNDDCSGAVV